MKEDLDGFGSSDESDKLGTNNEDEDEDEDEEDKPATQTSTSQPLYSHQPPISTQSSQLPQKTKDNFKKVCH